MAVRPFQLIRFKYMSKKLVFILFFLIIVVASILRLYQIGEVPPSPDWDEAALGYNAYSIMHTGRDEFDKFLPVVIRSFDDYKPALYMYTIIPFLQLFDLSVVAVRLPSAIFGILTVIVVYFLIKELFEKKVFGIPSDYFALLTSFFLAISPWHIQFSRVAFESNLGLALNVFATLFFLKGLKNRKYLFLSAVIFGLNLYSYQSNKVFTPLLLFSLILIYRKQLFSIKKKFLIIACLIGLIIALPMVYFTLTNKNALARAQGVSFLSQKTPLLQNDIHKLKRDQENSDTLGLILDNRRITYTKTVVSNYLSHFNLNWLFIQGDFNDNRHHAPNMGLFYIFTLPFLFIGIYKLFFVKIEDGISKNSKIIIFVWLLIAPIPAMITIDVPHGVRTLNMVPIFQIFISLGAVTTIIFLQKLAGRHKALIIGFYTFFLIVGGINFLYYLDQYFIQQNFYYSKDWQYGYKQLVNFLEPIHNNYKKIIVSNSGQMEQSYMFFLFFLQYDPKLYLSEGGTFSGGFAQNKNKFSNFEFRSFNYYQEKSPDVLFVGAPNDFPEEFNERKEVKYLDGTKAFRVVQ